MTTLQELRDKLYKTDCPDRELYIEIMTVTSTSPAKVCRLLDAEAWTDASLTLIELLLPGWSIEIIKRSHTWYVNVTPWVAGDKGYSRACAPTSDLAILLALAEALIVKSSNKIENQ